MTAHEETVQSMALPCTAGCIDLRRPQITHAYCPPNDIAPLPGGHSAAACAMWQPGSPFASLHHRFRPPSQPVSWEPDDPTGSACLDFLDFSNGCSSPCSVLGRSYTQKRAQLDLTPRDGFMCASLQAPLP